MSNSAGQSHLGEREDEITQVTNRRSKRRSRVWEFFKELPGEGKAFCIYCKKGLVYINKGMVCHILSAISCPGAKSSHQILTAMPYFQ
jgi:hypothetical protein